MKIINLDGQDNTVGTETDLVMSLSTGEFDQVSATTPIPKIL